MLKADRLDTTWPTRSAADGRRRCLRLYHAAPAQAVPAILRTGIMPGQVALTPTLGLAATWLCDDASTCADLGSLELGAAERALLGFDPGAGLRPAGAASAPLAVLTVRVPVDDRRLLRWATCAPRRLPLWLAALSRLGAVPVRGWFLYRGAIPAAWITPATPAAACAGMAAAPAAAFPIRAAASAAAFI